MATSHPLLPVGFRFGASTASFQIEGGVDEGGRGPSTWDAFCAQPGRISDGSDGSVACAHYHRYAEDVALMRAAGLDSYRFSIAWPRVQPTGSGPANAAGLDFYDRLVDELVAAGIAPMATLFHWDLPLALQQTADGPGGWQSRETAERFAAYAALCVERLGDRVAMWAPVNEPNVVTVLGHVQGLHAPGLTLPLDTADGVPAVVHHLNLAHGLAVEALRAGGAREVGTATNHHPIWAASESEADTGAAEVLDDLWNRNFSDPVLLGRYPERLADVVPVRDGDLALISAPLDFYGFNYYNPMLVSARAEPAEPGELPVELREITGYPTTGFGWPVVPDGLREQIALLVDRYPGIPPLHVTENGCAYPHSPDRDGVVDDQPRIDYYDAHLRAVADAIADGADVRGYYAWSLLDNFEWAEGYSQRFGLVHVDYETLARTPKRSFQWYAATISAQPGR